MCIPAAEAKHDLTEAVNQNAAEIAKNAPRYEMRFKAVEFYESLKQKVKKTFSNN